MDVRKLIRMSAGSMEVEAMTVLARKGGMAMMFLNFVTTFLASGRMALI